MTQQPLRPVMTPQAESGFILASVTVIILVTIAMLATFVFVAQRDFRFKNHYAAGQRIAAIASHGHLFTQRIFHQGTPVSGVILFDSEAADTSMMGFADQANFGVIGGVRYGIEIRGWDNSPITDPAASDKAVSAYMQIKVRTTGTQSLRPTDRTAFMAGAAQNGMTRVGIIDTASSEFCDGDVQVVRWGAEDTACLTGLQLATLGFTDIQNGDLIIPTWEVALATASPNALYRYKQPERPELNSMTTDLEMMGQDVNDVSNVTTRNLTASDEVEIDTMQVRDGHYTNFAQQTTMHNSFSVRDDNPLTPTTPAMQVSGITQFTSAQFNVADTIYVGDPANPVHVDVVNPVATETIEGTGGTLTVNPHNPTDMLTMAAQQSSQPFASLIIIDNSGAGDTHLAATTGVNTSLLETDDQIFSGNLNILPSVIGLQNATGISTGAIEQVGIGSGHYIQLPNVGTTICTGIACPDFVTDTPGGEL